MIPHLNYPGVWLTKQEGKKKKFTSYNKMCRERLQNKRGRPCYVEPERKEKEKKERKAKLREKRKVGAHLQDSSFLTARRPPPKPALSRLIGPVRNSSQKEGRILEWKINRANSVTDQPNHKSDNATLFSLKKKSTLPLFFV